ncbi:hypothetical protein KKA47_01115 [bacterium]|nr:hypothetical protein [bacterium]
MKDTHPEIDQIVKDKMLNKSGVERFKMGCSMFDMAKKLVISSILSKNPHMTLEDQKSAIFLRFYKNDFTEGQLKSIIAKISLIRGSSS